MSTKNKNKIVKINLFHLPSVYNYYTVCISNMNTVLRDFTVVFQDRTSTRWLKSFDIGHQYSYLSCYGCSTVFLRTIMSLCLALLIFISTKNMLDWIKPTILITRIEMSYYYILVDNIYVCVCVYILLKCEKIRTTIVLQRQSIII